MKKDASRRTRPLESQDVCGGSGGRAHRASVPDLADRGIQGALAILEALGLLQFLEGLAELGLRIVELDMEVLGREAKVVPPLGSGACIGRVGKVVGVGDPGLLLLHGDFPIEISRHAVEFRNHHVDLRDPPTFFVDLKALEADERIPRLHLD